MGSNRPAHRRVPGGAGKAEGRWKVSQYDAKQAVAVADARDAVIEAAKALGIIRLLADARDGRDFTTEQCRALRDFEGAVAALQEVEGG